MPLIRNFSECDDLSPPDFERFVAEAFEAAGWRDIYQTVAGRDRSQGDGGVDLFARKDKHRFAIEVKQRAAGTAVGVDALNQLVTGAQLAGIRRSILVTNSYFTREVTARALVLGVELFDRDRLQTLWIERHSEVGRRISPRSYQRDVINEVLSKLDAGKNRFLLEMATGLGKTYTAALLCRTLAGKLGLEPLRLLFMAHRIEILSQSLTAFKNVFGISSHSYSICSNGQTPANTDFVFASVDTLHTRIADLPRHGFDVVMLDEAHHAAAPTFSVVVNHFEPKVLFGLTATPSRMDNRDVHQFFGGDEGRVGRLDLPWALRERKLAFPKYHVLLDDLDAQALVDVGRGFQREDIDRKIFLHKRDEEVIRIIDQTIADQGIEDPKAIVFCRSVEHIHHLIRFFPPGIATMAYGKLPGVVRRENVERFRNGDSRYILVCDLFNEGVDVPETNILVFLRSTASRTVWLQQLGRGLRKTPTKEHVYVLDFVGSLDRIGDVCALQREVDRKPPAPDTSKRSEVNHDGSLEVTFSRNAADVLRLIEDLELHLQTRRRIIEPLREYFERTQELSFPFDVALALPEVASSQVLTLFGSLRGLFAASFGCCDQADAWLRGELLAAGAEYARRTGLAPSARLLSLQSEKGRLPLATAAEIETLFGGKAALAAHFSSEIDAGALETSKDCGGMGPLEDLLARRRKSER